MSFALVLAAAVLLGGCSTPTESATPASQTPTWKKTPEADYLGVELEGLGDGGRSMTFVDLAKTLRPFTNVGSDASPALDENGWPLEDAQTVLFDIRPFGTWAPPIDDPERFQPDWSGTYKLSFRGKADLSFADASNAEVANLKYDPAKNVSTADLKVAKGSGLAVLVFKNTSRGAGDRKGFSNLRVIRPGYAEDTKETFTKEFLAMVKPFRILRYMDWLDTNHNPGFYGDTGHHALGWKDRTLPTDATQVTTADHYGVAWEHCVELANATGKDMWINIPVAATDEYVTSLASLLKKSLKPEIRIFIEHSNEVWNFGFPQYIYNKLAAIEEAKDPSSKLRSDGNTEEERWTHRRHAKRLHEITQAFLKEFGAASLKKRIFPVYASWVINPDSHYKDVLAWYKSTYGDPSKTFYALAGAAYYNAQNASQTASPTELLDVMRKNSDGNMAFHKQLKEIADANGLAYCQYEIGPDNGGGSDINVANRIRANRIPQVKDLLLHDAKGWFAMGGKEYMYFAAPSGYSRHGCWGLSEDVKDLASPKWEAIYELTGYPGPKK